MLRKKVDILHGPIKTVLLTLATPIILSNFIQTLLGIVDMIWIGKLGGEAVSAIGTAGFYINLANALTTLVAVGTGIKVAHAIGENNIKKRDSYIINGVVMSFVLSLLFVGIVFLFTDALIAFYGMNHPAIEAMAKSYLRTSLIGVPFLFLVTILITILTSFGETKTTFKANSIGLIFNIIVDPLFIFGFGIIPKMGVNGAALATNLARILIFLVLVLNLNVEIKESLKTKLNYKRMLEVIKMSLPVTIQRMTFIYISMVMAKIIVSFGTDYIAVQKIGVQIESISYVSIGGLQGAFAAFVGQNYGSQNFKRIQKAYHEALKMVFVFALIVSAIFILFPQEIFRIFIQDEAIIQGGIQYMQAIGFSQLFMCIELLTVGAFNGVGKTYIPPISSIILTLARIPLALMLSSRMGVLGVWWSISISSMLKGSLLFVWFHKYIRKERLKHEYI